MSDYVRNAVDDEGNPTWVRDVTVIEPQHLNNYEDGHEKAIRQDPSTEGRATILPDQDIRGLILRAYPGGSAVALKFESYAPNSETVASDQPVGNASTYLLCDSTSGDLTITLPPAGSRRFLSFKKLVAANNVIIQPDGSDTIDGASSLTIENLNSNAQLISDGVTGWYIV